MDFVILGPTALHLDGRRVPIGAAKQRGMLAVLLYHVGQPVRLDTIVEQLWDGRTLDDCRESLYALASRTRAVLNSVGLPNALVRVHGIAAYRLDLDPNLVDFHRFRRLVTQARDAANQHHHDTAATVLTKAIGMWRDEPLADLRGARSEHIRRHMTDVLLDAHKLLAASQLRIGRHRAVLARLEPLLDTYDLDETLAQQWITALCAAGRRNDARTFVNAFRRRFRKEMRTEPAIELPDAGERIRISRAGAVYAHSHTDSPAPATGPRQLPKDIDDFTGHDELLAELDALTDPSSNATTTVVLSGMPGVGKTTLAIHWAHRQRHRFPDGHLYLNANAYGPTPAVEPDDALARFLYALDVPADHIPASADQRRDLLNQLLNGRRVLIVLDNIGDSGQVRPLLPTSKTCMTLITSRNRLTGLSIRDGVRNMTVAPLPGHESLALLRHMLGTARAAAEPEALHALARLSGGLPLALRIIGEHVAERPRATIADLVDELSTHLLDGEGVDDEEANLRTVFAWSYTALRPDAARLFRILGLHPGANISPEVAAAMADISSQLAEQLLNTLAKAHLINHDTARRYRFHDLLRIYAADHAHREETVEHADSALRRLLDWYLLSAANAAALLAPQRSPVPDLPQPAGIEPLTFLTDLDAMRWCEAERANLGAVTRAAANNGFYRHGWQIPGVVHEIFERYGRQDDVLELHELALSSAQLDNHQIGQIGTLNNLGTTYFALHDHHRAAASFEAALQLARDINYLDAETACAHNLASVHLTAGDTATAVRIYQQVLDTCRTISHAAGEASTLHRLGDACTRTNNHDQAIAYYRQALAIRERIGSLRGQGMTHRELATVYLQTGQPQLALAHCQQALDIHHRTKDEAGRCDTLITMADVERALAMPKDAVRHAQRAIAISDDIADSQRRSRALTVLADTLAAAGNAGAARRVCMKALSILDEVGGPQARPLRDRLLTIRKGLPD